MNRENVLKAIEVMKRAGAANSVNMKNWQNFDVVAKKSMTSSELHACGNTACFAGHIAMSPEFQADGGEVGFAGMPVIGDVSGEHAIKRWLSIPKSVAGKLVYGERLPSDGYCIFYEKPWDEVNADDVIAKLQLILKGDL